MTSYSGTLNNDTPLAQAATFSWPTWVATFMGPAACRRTTANSAGIVQSNLMLSPLLFCVQCKRDQRRVSSRAGRGHHELLPGACAIRHCILNVRVRDFPAPDFPAVVLVERIE